MERALGAGCTEMDALRGFFMFDGDESRVLAYVDGFVTLKDLGFGQERIDEALVASGNDQEKALEQLMSQ